MGSSIVGLISFVLMFNLVSCNIHRLMTESEREFYFGDDVSDYELIDLPLNVKASMGHRMGDQFKYNFQAFGRNFDLNLQPNYKLMSPSIKFFKHDGDRRFEINEPIENCHFLYQQMDLTAALSFCQKDSVNGFILVDNSTLEIKPLNKRLSAFLKYREALISDSIDSIPFVPHLIKRSYSFLPSYENLPWNDLEDFDTDTHRVEITPVGDPIWTNNLIKRGSQRLTIEIAVFFDAAAYKLFSPYMGYNDRHMRDMLLAYINGVQALYHHPSLGTSIDIVIVRMDMMKSQPKELPHYNGERSKLLDSFCDYQKEINPPGDNNPNHWDIALYVSGLDFYAMENGRKSGVTMGLATVGGVCIDKYACVIAELGTTNAFGKPYPSAGFTSVYIMAHEIGHNLGMHHDSSGNSCPKDGYIMSPSRGTNGETLWSHCSADVVKNLNWAKCLFDVPTKKPAKDLDQAKFLDSPGQKFSAKKQCEVLLKDRDANILPSQELNTICYNLQCKTPHRSGYYFSGPALEGTACGEGKWCFGGECVKTTKPKPGNVIHGGWTAWNSSACQSGCIKSSVGYKERRRSCSNPVPVNSDQGCEGPSYDVILCKDNKVCPKKQPVTTYASMKCKEFAQRLPELDKQSSGLQAPHEEGRPWMGCAIFCRRKDSGTFYTPRLELNDLGISPYFPDGTWCHKDGGGDYFCVQHHCLPENFQLTKTNLWNGIGEDIPMSQNAHPHGYAVPPSLLSYLSLGADGKPLQTQLTPGDSLGHKEQDWETHDYLELPDHNEILPDLF